ncbi:hypothetical protein N7495_002870 [Penicillium taxi]|uniref:uncharacterized protein n=1 Tax=Penicillium taxi TaxID=168475 RepID=UPI00254568FD|nr:uncharacterized protein N7495_002870 [Penicillium taxi]KAJ5902342.1 hypothetical protein N7495_002870 [Penicillium taxi]
MLSFMGPQQGRIIQASYDGWQLNLQYSQLWSFRDEKTAPLEMFVRYFIAQPNISNQYGQHKKHKKHEKNEKNE